MFKSILLRCDGGSGFLVRELNEWALLARDSQSEFLIEDGILGPDRLGFFLCRFVGVREEVELARGEEGGRKEIWVERQMILSELQEKQMCNATGL